ncbi:hypothetical protein [Mucilaginibacter kameinonensis]|uniref:hypothetical protein n=1 Tax=Mucilaginibacter kameinonensis TaxID=452286 RepID=UPI000EF7BB0B|nr:hypothetical protein [Mucilaginibacter kameinonensis]
MQETLLRKSFLIVLFLSVFYTEGFAQTDNSDLAKKVIINNICLCQTTIADLKKSDPNLKDTVLEEMDLNAVCVGNDPRYIAGSGYSTSKYPGMIFQQDQKNDLISKIRLTKAFAGKLPDGKEIDLSKLLLKDLFKLYPAFKEQWYTRGCSDYWNFSNDTLSFYVKIDSAKKSVFPIDEAYYMDKPVEAADLILSCHGAVKEDTQQYVTGETENNEPVYFIDSVRVTGEGLNKLNSNDVATVSVYRGANAIIKYGREAKYGLIYIETKKFDIRRFQNYFKSKSADYAKLISTPANASKVQYILNKKVLINNYEGNLAGINDKIFKGLTIINKRQLVKQYGITNKDYGVIITADIPVNSFNKDKEKEQEKNKH